MTIDKKLLTLLVCPICKMELEYQKQPEELICRFHNLAYPVRDGIPIMLASEAKRLTVEK